MSGKTRPPHGCLDCGARWFGLTFCHCTVCHLTFGGVGPFDAHQVNGGKCLNVSASRTFYEPKKGVWSLRSLAAGKVAATPATTPIAGRS